MQNGTSRGRGQKRRGLSAFFIGIGILIVLLVTVLLLWPRIGRQIEQPVREFFQPFSYPVQFEELILHYSEARELDPFLVMGLIQAESSYDSEAVSPVGARGLMQIMPNTGQWLAERKGIDFQEEYLFIPAYNIRMGTYYLRMLIDMFEVWDTALAAYNAGMGNVGNWLQDERYSYDGLTLHTIPFAETRHYVERVNRYMEIYRELYEAESQ